MRVYSKKRNPVYAVLALLVLVAELGFTVLGPIAESREPVSVGLHFDGPNSKQKEHNPTTCAVCLAMQAPTLPVSAQSAIIHLTTTPAVALLYTRVLPVHHTQAKPAARGPPHLG
jgi:hypothetical protein